MHSTLYERLVEARLGYNHGKEDREMRTVVPKQHILDSAGYIYNFYRVIYFSRGRTASGRSISTLRPPSL